MSGQPVSVKLYDVKDYLEWIKEKLYLNTLVNTASKRAVKRGQVYRCNFGVGVGSEMRKDRPAVILQATNINKSSSNVIVAPITHDTDTIPCLVPIATQYGTDGKTVLLDGSVNTSNIMCVSKARLGNYVGTLSKQEMESISKALLKMVDLFNDFLKLETKCVKKDAWISELKVQRNEAQDELKLAQEELKCIRDIFGIDDNADLIEKLKQAKNSIDKEA